MADQPSVDVVLASGSPRRRELLARHGVKFRVHATDVDEELDADTLANPEEAAKKLAERKAGAAVQELLTKDYVGLMAVIGADTVVVLDGEIFGKPANPGEAKAMLTRLSGREHQVITAVSVWGVVAGEGPEDVSVYMRTLSETSHVKFKNLTSGRIEAYVATGEPMDKAGAYGIQGKAGEFVEYVNGDYDNVVGLPVKRLLAEFPDIFASAR